MASIPTEIKKLKGTLDKRYVLENEMQVIAMDQIPPAPENLSAGARELWTVTCTELKRNNILTGVDLSLIEAYCAELQTYKDAAAELQKNGAVVPAPSGYPVVSPWQSIKNQSLKNAVDIGKLFGITPAARTKISSDVKPVSKIESLKKPKIA
jgi:P27 family predicted phage terminase small subunit